MLKRLWVAKYLLTAGVILCGSLYVSEQYQRVREECTNKCDRIDPTTTSPSSPCEDRDKCEQDAERNFPPWFRLFGWPEGIATWAILLTLLAIAEQTHQTRRAAEAAEASVGAADKQYVLAENTAKRQLRAYLAVRDAKALLYDDGVLEASLKLHNCGQTPAYGLQGAYKVGFSPYPIPTPGTPPEDTRKSISVLGAGGDYYILAKFAGLPGQTMNDTVKELHAPDFVFSLVGYFTYKDIFENEHFIRFQQIIGGPSGPLRYDRDDKGRVFASFCNDSEGNEAD